MIRRLHSALTAAALAAAFLTACGDDGITLPDERAAAAIEIQDGDDQTGAVGSALPNPVSALVTDADGNPVVDQLVEFSVTGGGQADPSSTQTNASGIAEAQWVLGTGAGQQSLTARPVGNGAANVSATATAIATAGPAVAMELVGGTPQTAVAGTPLPNPLVVVVEDEFGNPVPGVQVEWTLSGGGSVSEPTTTTGEDGRASVTRTLGPTTGDQGTQAAVEGLDGSPVSFTATATVGSAGQLTIERQPSSTAQSGVAFGTQPQVQLRDASGNAVSQAGVAIQAELASGPGTASLSGSTLAATNGSGVATFTNLGITGPAGQYTINFRGANLSLTGVTSGTITIAAGAPAALRFAVQPSNSVAGSAISPPVIVELIDAQGNLVTTQTRTVNISLQNAAGASLSGTTSVATVGGVATFSSLSVNRAGSGYRLAAAATGVSGATSDPFTVSTGAATKLAFITQPSSTQAGATISPAVRVEVRDASDNPVTGFSGPVTISLASNPAGGVLSGTLTVNASSGVATFDDLSIDRAGTYSLQATSGSLTQATSSSFSVGAGSAANIEKIAGDNQNAQVGTVVPTDPRVKVTDASGNPVSGVTVTFAVASGGGSVSGATPTTNSNGEAAVGSWTLGGSTGTNTLTASAPNAGSVTFTATGQPGSGSQLEFEVAPPSTVASGALMTPSPVVQIVDAGGNPVSTSGVPITISISSGATLSGTTTRNTDSNGRANFTGLTASGPAGTYTLTFSGQGTPLTANIEITAGSPSGSQSSVQASPATITAGGSTDVTVTAEDAAGNPVSGASVSLSVAPGPGNFGSASLTTNSSGVATTTFTSTATGTQTIEATINGPTGGPVVETATVEIGAAGTTTNIIGHEPNPSLPGQPVTVTFAVGASGTSPSGLVHVSSSAGDECSGNTSIGECVLTFDEPGSVTITASFPGGGIYAPSSDAVQHTVALGATETLITSHTPEPSAPGDAVTVQFTVTSPSGTPAGTVLVTTDEPATCEADVTAGQCAVSFAASGTHTITAAYQGDGVFATSSDTEPHEVAAPPPPPPEGSPATVEVRRQPSPTAISGRAFQRQPEVRVRDAGGNSLRDVLVSVGLASGPGTLRGRTTDRTAPNGVGSWDDLRIDGIGAHTLRFTAGTVIALSDPIVVTP